MKTKKSNSSGMHWGAPISAYDPTGMAQTPKTPKKKTGRQRR